jgi:hypothetical protein
MGKSSPGVSSDVSQGEIANEQALVSIAQTQEKQSQQLFAESNPGFLSAENFYGALSTGSPYAISTAISPAVQQIGQATAGAKQNIMNSTPAGGEKNLALQQADVAQGAQVGQAATGSFLNSFNALAQLAGQGTGESISGAGTAISGLSSANQAWGQLGSQQLQAQQLQAQQKGSTLGALSSLGGAAFEGAGAAGGFGALF